MHPSSQPTNQPSRCPTISPISQPSQQPTRQPTMQPSQQPSTQPSSRPTGHPTGYQTRVPTVALSQKPSALVCPTGHPSNQPTVFPSSKPTSRPSLALLYMYQVILGVTETSQQFQADFISAILSILPPGSVVKVRLLSHLSLGDRTTHPTVLLS